MTINLEGNVLIVGCIECGRFECFTEWDAMVAAGWHDDETEHVSCPDHGPAWAAGVVVGSITDEVAFRESFTKWLAYQRAWRDQMDAQVEASMERLVLQHLGGTVH
jgi:hypothetical protein